MLAIVIPYYKISFFEGTLQSLANQTNKDFNVYIGNDASPDNPAELIKKFINKVNITYKSFAENLGETSLTKQWERCIEMAQDETWIMILCDDDILSNNVVEQFYNNLDQINKHKVKVIKYASQEINEFGNIISKKYCHPTLSNYSDVFFERFFNYGRSSLSEHIFLKSQFNKYGFKNFPLAWHSDDLAWLVFSEFEHIFSINDAIVFFRLSKTNISRRNYMDNKKYEVKYMFFTEIVFTHLKKFKKLHIPYILKRYELMTYNLNKGTFNFWKKLFPVILKHQGIYEAFKFSRRVYIQGKNG